MGRTRGRDSCYFKKLSAGNKCIPDSLLEALIRQRYQVVGKHSAAKLCGWAGKCLCDSGDCYKSKFYGIATHRCLQCTPVLMFCNHSCVFCWRMMPETKLGAGDLPPGAFEWEKPEKIVDGLIAAQKTIVSGFGGNEKVSRKKYLEACEPKHVAISLTGEPAMYPHLDGLIEEFHKRKMTTFLVTNGTFPERIAKMRTLPTQLYVSMVAPNEEVYKTAIRPVSEGLWKKYCEMLQIMPELGKRTRTVLRMTLARGVNDSDLEGYASQIKTAQPHYVEVKSMVFVGGARQPSRGLSLSSMLTMDEIGEIAKKLAKMTGYLVSDRHAPSRIVLLCKNVEVEKNRRIVFAD
ncbi:MAG: 4-demethylwyosine synthase TYW1 [Candidatus Micrarchaeota archaeon]|nr:4-demethylwyosine synthase TYW1 [Candidatus Micrarchaeota archaeon]